MSQLRRKCCCDSPPPGNLLYDIWISHFPACGYVAQWGTSDPDDHGPLPWEFPHWPLAAIPSCTHAYEICRSYTRTDIWTPAVAAGDWNALMETLGYTPEEGEYIYPPSQTWEYSDVFDVYCKRTTTARHLIDGPSTIIFGENTFPYDYAAGGWIPGGDRPDYEETTFEYNGTPAHLMTSEAWAQQVVEPFAWVLVGTVTVQETWANCDSIANSQAKALELWTSHALPNLQAQATHSGWGWPFVRVQDWTYDETGTVVRKDQEEAFAQYGGETHFLCRVWTNGYTTGLVYVDYAPTDWSYRYGSAVYGSKYWGATNDGGNIAGLFLVERDLNACLLIEGIAAGGVVSGSPGPCHLDSPDYPTTPCSAIGYADPYEFLPDTSQPNHVKILDSVCDDPP